MQVTSSKYRTVIELTAVEFDLCVGYIETTFKKPRGSKTDGSGTLPTTISNDEEKFIVFNHEEFDFNYICDVVLTLIDKDNNWQFKLPLGEQSPSEIKAAIKTFFTEVEPPPVDFTTTEFFIDVPPKQCQNFMNWVLLHI